MLRPKISAFRHAITRVYGWECAIGLLVLGSRLAVFSYAGSPLPYYDQWLAEFNNTFLQVAGGADLWSVLFTPHNEHVLLTTRIVSLIGFHLNGYWDVEFLVVVAAAIRALTAALTFHLLAAGAGRRARGIIGVACGVTFAVPFSGYNLLCGLQLSFYFADLALLGAIACVLHWSSGWRSGCRLVLASAFGLLSLGSAIAIPPATLAVHLATRRHRPGFAAAWLISALAVGVYLALLIPLQPARENLLSSRERVTFFLELFSWPLRHPAGGAALAVLAMALVWRLVRERRLGDRPVAACLGLGTFGVCNVAMIALNRSPDEFHMRHWETVALVPLGLTALAAVTLDRLARPLRWPWWLAGAVAGVYLSALASNVWRQTRPYIESARAHRAEAIVHYRELLVSGRIADERTRLNALLAAKDHSFFDDPIGRFTPHPVAIRNFLVAPLPAMALLAPEILPIRPPSRLSQFLRVVKNVGWLIGIAGIGLAALAVFDSRPRPAGRPGG